MIRLGAAAIVVAIGCAPSERDCAALREYVDGSGVTDMPRRYREASGYRDAAELAVAVTGCTPSAREHDCAEVRRLLQQPFALPPSGDVGIFDPTVFENLKTRTYRDAEVREAVLALTSKAWKTYLPGNEDAESAQARARVATLCHLGRTASGAMR